MSDFTSCTPQSWFHKRRLFLKLGAGSIVSPLLVESLLANTDYQKAATLRYQSMDAAQQQAINGEILPLTSVDDATSYNNFYEFGFGKSDPKKYSHSLKPSPWTIHIEGEVEKPMSIELESLLEKMTLVERIYRFRCVEAWSMVIPWIGFELRELIDYVKPTKNAHYVRFTTLYDPEQFPAQKSKFSGIPFPYQEGLRMDEAQIPLVILAVGMYQKRLLAQNGAPLRLVVPWKYGFKSIKSINKIEFVSDIFTPTWQALEPSEYGFYGNVDPQTPHPRWSQSFERKIGERGRKKTLYLNGYADSVAHLYEGMDRASLY